jgi:hypothetical protein
MDLRARADVGWFDPAAVDTRLTRLGVTDDTRRRAGLTAERLQSFQSDVAFIRHGPRQMVGLSQQAADGHWGHLLPKSTTGWRPILLTDAPRGREDVRQVVVAMTAERGAGLAGALRQEDDVLGRRYAVVLGGPGQMADGFEPLTRRALLIAPDYESTTRAMYRTGAELTARGFGVRIAIAEATTPVHLDESPEFSRWQFEIMRSDVGLEPGSDEAVAWLKTKVLPLVQAAPDKLAAAVLMHRAQSLAANGTISETAAGV